MYFLLPCPKSTHSYDMSKLSRRRKKDSSLMLKNKIKFSQVACLYILVYLCPQITKTRQEMEVVSIERSTYEELLTSFNSFVTKMKEMASRGNDKGLGDWLDNQDVCQMLNIKVLLMFLTPF